MSCGILVTQPGIKPVPSALEVCGLNHCTVREVPRVAQFLGKMVLSQQEGLYSSSLRTAPQGFLSHSCSVRAVSAGVLALQPPGLQHARLLCPPPSPGVCSDSCPLSWWCYPIFWLAKDCYPFAHPWLFTSGGQSIRTSATIFPMNIQAWFPLGSTGLISLQSEGLSRVLSSTAQKHQFFGTQSSLWSNSHIHSWLLEKP